MKLYIAAQYARREEMKAYRDQAEYLGITVTSRWLEETCPVYVSLQDSLYSNGTRQALAVQDEEDIVACDVLVFFSEPQNQQPPRGGRHVELGIARGLKKPIIVVASKGEPYGENIFHSLPGITLVPGWYTAQIALCQLMELID